MQRFKAAFWNELSRIFRKRKTVVFSLINLVIVGFYYLLYSFSPVSIMFGAIGSFMNLHGLFFMVVFPLFIFMEIMDVFSGEMSNLVIRNVLIRPVTRTKIYLAKVCAVCIFILAQILFVAVASGVFLAMTGTGAASIVKNSAAFIITFIPMVGLAFTAAFISQVVRSGLLGMLLCIFFMLASYAAEALMPTLSAFLFLRHIDMYKMLLTGNIQIYGIFSALFIIAAYIGVTFTAGVLLFEKKEF